MSAQHTGCGTSGMSRHSHVGPMVLGNMDIGLNTANLAAIVVIVLLTVLNTFGVKMGAAVQNVFTSAKVLALAGGGVGGRACKRTRMPSRPTSAQAGITSGLGRGWHTLHPVQVGVGGPMALVGLLTMLAVVQVGSLFSSDAWNNVTFTAGEIRESQAQSAACRWRSAREWCMLLYMLCNFVYLSVLPMHGDR